MSGHQKAPIETQTPMPRRKAISKAKERGAGSESASAERRTLLLELACVLLKVVEALLSLGEHLR